MEKRLLLAFVLSAVIFAIWSALFPPSPPDQLPASGPDRAESSAAVEEPSAASERPESGGEADRGQPERAAIAPVVRGAEETTVRLGNAVFEAELTTRGAAVASLVLKGYTGDEGEPLDLIQHLPGVEHSRPLQLVTEAGPDERLYAVEEVEGGYRFRWSDGTGTVAEKTVRVGSEEYGLEVEVVTGGEMESAWLSAGTGMRDIGELEKENRFATWGDAVMLADGEVEEFRREKVQEPETLQPGALSFAGFQDTYFLGVMRPRSGVDAVRIRPVVFPQEAEDGGDGDPLQVLEVTLRPAGRRFEGEFFGAPKEYQLLQRVDAGLERTLDFGFFHPISVLFLKALRWIHGLVGNYGVAIILLTLGIRIVLFPLMHTSTVSMRKMQKVQPKLKAIQEKYRKNKSDPQVRAKMNQEIMALYKAEGVNPMGGCLPLLVQMPILLAMYTLFAHAIELRHAPFVFWITDLSAKDPYYITPVLMTATMWLQQRLAPQAGDPQQQKIFRLMPLVFGIMFLGFPSGLVLYWLSNNVITIIQQEVTLHLIGERQRSGRGGKGKRQ